MKKLFLIALCIIGFSYMSSARVVEIYKSKGLFGYYGNITQTYMGNINGEDWWILVCKNWGFNDCRLHPTAGKTARAAEIEGIENTQLGVVMNDIESDHFNNGELTGTENKHYQSTLSDGTTVDIYMTVSWKQDPNDPDGLVFNASITNNG